MLLMKVRDLHWKKHPNLERIYDNLSPIASVLEEHRARFSGRSIRAIDQIISTDTALVSPTSGPWSQTTHIMRYSCSGCRN